MKRTLIAATIVVSSITAFAGKAERDSVTKNLNPAVKTAEEKVKASCGCALAITVDDSTIGALNDINNAKYMAEDISKEAPKYCTDDASKKAVCQLKTLSLAKAKPAAFTFNAGKGTLTHDGQAHATWTMMMRQLDK